MCKDDRFEGDGGGLGDPHFYVLRCCEGGRVAVAIRTYGIMNTYITQKIEEREREYIAFGYIISDIPVYFETN